MSLTNSQYDAIMYKYEKTRLENHRILEERRQYVYDHVDGYREIDDLVISYSREAASKRMSGDTDSLEELHATLADFKDMKARLLMGVGLPADYLEPIYTCKDCKDTGYIDSKRCHCLEQQVIDVLYSQSNIKEFLQANNFDTLTYKYHSGEALSQFEGAVALSHRFVDNFAESSSNILFCGDVGTGKSFLSGCIAKSLIDKGHSVIYFSATSFFETIARETFDSKSKEELYNLYDYIYNCDLLIIDDLGTELTNSFVSSSFFTCINERCLRRKSTIISTNLSLEDIRDRYSDRIFSRIISGFTICKLTGPDLRIKIKTTT